MFGWVTISACSGDLLGLDGELGSFSGQPPVADAAEFGLVALSHV